MSGLTRASVAGVALAVILAASPLVVSPAYADGPYDQAQNSAVEWADTEAEIGDTYYDRDGGQCLQFVLDAYRIGSGVDLAPLGDTYSARLYWETFNGIKFTSVDPPAGALVFWGAHGDYVDGHVAISLGDGRAISSMERSYSGAHVFSIADRNATSAAPYLGYVIPA